MSVELGPALRAGQGRGRVGRPREAVDPRRRDGSGDRGRLPRRWAGTRPRALVLRLLGERIDEGAAGPGGDDYKTRLQELAARRVRPAAALPGARRGSRPLEALLRDRSLIAGAACGQGEGRSKKQAEQAAARSGVARGWPSPCRRTRRQSTSTARSTTGATMPELPEVEVVRRDLEREVVGRTDQVRSRSTAMRSVRRHQQSQAVHRRGSRATRSPASSGAGKYLLVRLDGRRRRSSSTSGCRVSCCAAERARGDARRSTPTS